VTGRANGGDRIVLFTLVDLLVQIIFCGFLIFAANRAAEGAVQDQVDRLVQAFKVANVTKYMDATSKLVAIADLDKAHLYDPSEKSKTLFSDVTHMLQGLDAKDLGKLAGMDAKERAGFMTMYASMSPGDRQLLSKFVAQNGTGSIKSLSRLNLGDQAKFNYLAKTFVDADPVKRQMIVATTARLVRPRCFNGRSAFKITEKPGMSYLVQPLIPQVAPDVARLLSGAQRAGNGYFLNQPAFMTFGSAVSSAHAACIIEIDQATETNDERQLISIQRWFGTH
jgi:hypothetical protein